MIPPPDDLVEVSLEVLSTEVVVDADQSALHLGDHCLGRVHVSAGLRVGILFLAVDHILVVGHGFPQTPVALASIGHQARRLGLDPFQKNWLKRRPFIIGYDSCARLTAS